MDRPVNYVKRRGSVVWYDEQGKYHRMLEEEFERTFNSSPELLLDDEEPSGDSYEESD